MWLNLLIDSWIFWPLLFVLFGTFAFLAESNGGPSATGLLVGIITGLELFSSYKPLTWVISNPVGGIWFFGAYLLIGFFYMYVKYAFVARRAAQLSRDKETSNHGTDREYYYYHEQQKSIPFVVAQWKSELATWFAFWPFSAAWTLLNDPIRIAFENVYIWSSKLLQAVSDSFFKK